MTLARTFPIRLAPLPGEALDSWLEALASRLYVRFGDVLDDLGLGTTARRGDREIPVRTDRTIALREEDAVRIAHATGTSPQQLHDMTLMRYDGLALRISPQRRSVIPHILWGRQRGSRFCPECLAGNGGRWPLAWRLGWSFACPAHSRLLADCCPACGRVQRELPFSRQALPVPGRCGTRPPRNCDRAVPAGCGQDLSLAGTLRLPAGHPALALQRLIIETIESGSARFGAYELQPQPAAGALSDLRAVAIRVLADLPAGDLPGWVPRDIADAHLSPDEDGNIHHRAMLRPGFMAPPRAASTAAGVTAAFRILGEPAVQQAGAVMRELMETIREKLWQPGTAGIDQWGHGITPVLRAVYLAAAGPSMRPSDQLRCRITASLPAPPKAGKAQISQRARKLPAVLWPSWAVRISPPGGAYYRTLVPSLTSAVLLVGNRAELDEAAAMLGSVTTATGVSRLLRLLSADPRWEAIATAMTRLAAYLDDHDVPIDYQRRRELDFSDLLTSRQWLDVCRRTGTIPGRERRHKVARCLLFTRISGLPVEAAPDFDVTVSESYFRTETARFAAIRTPELAEALDETARGFLARHRAQGEPVTWHPPTSLLAGLDLPGPDPSLINVTRLHELVRAHAGSPVQHTAEVLGTTVSAIRLALDEYPAPAAPLTTAQARAGGKIRHAARQVLDEREFRRRYIDEHQSIRSIAGQIGSTPNVVTSLASEYGIQLRPKSYRPRGTVDRDWLFEQYVNRRRTLSDLAREKNMSETTMARWARHHQIPIRSGSAGSPGSPAKGVGQSAPQRLGNAASLRLIMVHPP